MATRNFVFRKSPTHGQRGSRFVLGGPTNLTSGVPVKVDGSTDGLGRRTVTIATGAQNKPLPGQGGILVFENIDSLNTLGETFSDVDLAVPGDAVQVVTGNGGSVKVAFTNTASTNSFGRTGYPKARVMVAGVSQATPSVAPGDYLTPGVGNDASGYWAETSNAAEAWLVVTSVDSTNGIVEAELLV